MQDLIEQVGLGLRELLCCWLDAKLLPQVLENHDIRHALIALEIRYLELNAHLLHDMLFCLHVYRLRIGNDAVHIVDKCLHENASIRVVPLPHRRGSQAIEQEAPCQQAERLLVYNLIQISYAVLLFNRDRLCEVTRFVDIAAARDGGIVSEQLERHDRQQRQQELHSPTQPNFAAIQSAEWECVML